MSAIKSMLAVALLLGLLIGTPAVHAGITRIEIERVESPTFGGATFGEVGQYEKLVGRAYGELDPRDELNSGIVYIDKSPLNAAGRVEYSVDVLIFKPIDLARGNRTLFFDVLNRGGMLAFVAFHYGADRGNDPKNAGDGFLLKQGYTIVTSGWQGDVPSGRNRMSARFPVAMQPDGRPITKLITSELMFTKPAYTAGVGYESGLDMRPYPAAPDRTSEAK